MTIGALGPVAREGDAVWLKQLAANHVVSRGADEKVAAGLLAEQLVAVRRGAVGGGDLVVGADSAEALVRFADVVDLL